MPATGERLQKGLDELGIQASPGQLTDLLDYLSLLVRWNASFNLTAVRDPLVMVNRHLLDSLAIQQFVKAPVARLVDVGTGAGLPGVPLAIMRPDCAFDLLDSNGKKTRFLFQVKTALGLANMAVRHARVENWAAAHPYDVVVSRAFASLPDMVSCCAHLCSGETRLLAMKGQLPAGEIEALGPQVRVLGVHPLTVPGLDEERHLVEMQLDKSFPEGHEAGKDIG